MHYRATHGSGSSLAGPVSPVGSAAAFGVRAGAVRFATVLTALAAQLSVPVPWTAVPFTMQPAAVLLAGAVLGARRGALSQVLYLLGGITGAAMFAWSPALAPGLARLAGPTGGFLLAFPAAAFAVGALADRGWTRTAPRTAVALLTGLGALYAGGASWTALLAGPASVVALWPFLASDLAKVAIMAAVLPAAARALERRS